MLEAAAPDGFVEGQAVTVTCDNSNLAPNPDAGTAITFSIVSSTDTAELSAQPGYTAASASPVGWGGVTPDPSPAYVGHTPVSVAFVFTPTNTVGVGGYVTITASTSIWAAAGTTNCDCSPHTGVAYPDTSTLTLTTASEWTGGQAVTVTCVANLAPNAVADTQVEFSIVSASDVVALSDQTGYTTVGQVER